jgi:hypothetical protein
MFMHKNVFTVLGSNPRPFAQWALFRPLRQSVVNYSTSVTSYFGLDEYLEYL